MACGTQRRCQVRLPPYRRSGIFHKDFIPTCIYWFQTAVSTETVCFPFHPLLTIKHWSKYSDTRCSGIPPETITPDKVETRIGTLEYKDGAPTVETAQKVYDTLDFTRALNVYNNSFRGASAYGLLKGFRSIGAKENTVVIFSELMDSNSLFLTANADTVYYLSVVDLTKGPMVIEQPPKSVGAINDMWFSWIIDIGFPGPDRGEGGKYLIVPAGYEGPLPDSGFHVALSKTDRILFACRAYLVDNDPKPDIILGSGHGNYLIWFG